MKKNKDISREPLSEKEEKELQSLIDAALGTTDNPAVRKTRKRRPRPVQEPDISQLEEALALNSLVRPMPAPSNSFPSGGHSVQQTIHGQLLTQDGAHVALLIVDAMEMSATGFFGSPVHGHTGTIHAKYRGHIPGFRYITDWFNKDEYLIFHFNMNGAVHDLRVMISELAMTYEEVRVGDRSGIEANLQLLIL